MKQHLVGFLFALSPLLLSGCDDTSVPEEPEVSVCPEPVVWEITLTTDWTDRTEGIAVPDSYTVVIDDNQSLNYTAPTNPLPLLSEGTYPMLVYNTAEKITVSGTTATVATAGDTVDSTPGWFFASTPEIVVADRDSSITVAVQQQIRQLTIELTVTEGDATRITGTTATLSGIANTLDIATNTHSGSGLKISPAFVRIDNKLIATARLIGITTEAQVLTLTIALDNGTSQQVTSDISNTMAGFNANKLTPLFLSADLTITTSVVTPPVTPPTEPETPITPPTEPETPVTPPTEPETPVTPPTEPETPVTPPTEPEPPVTPPTEPEPPVTPPTEPEPPVTPPTEPEPPVTPPTEPEPPAEPVISESDFSATINNWQTGAGRIIEVK
ncbi:hypothetical protein AGMMS4957_06180 [Bacteroidia bacterium]|nr:hypothetical protein AGMMS4957_06180 [Bacteroidia bacterium]